MGQELLCDVTHDGRTSLGRALLETDDLVFRGDYRLKIPFKQITSIEAKDGRLHVAWPEGEATFHLGVKAETWADKIRNPKSLIDKLGVRPGMAVGVIDVDDATFIANLRARAEVAEDTAPPDAAIVFLGVESASDMHRLGALKHQIARDGAVWVVFRKGRKDFNENDVLRLGLESGLVDIKVVRFSDTHTATKFVIRKSDR